MLGSWKEHETGKDSDEELELNLKLRTGKNPSVAKGFYMELRRIQMWNWDFIWNLLETRKKHGTGKDSDVRTVREMKIN